MKNNARFHDPHGSSLHSHTQSSSAFLSWSSSSSNPSLSRPTTPPDHKHHHHPQNHYDEALAFTVRASLADGEEEGDMGQVHVREEEEEGEGKVRYRESRVEGLVTPPVDKAGKRIRYCVLEVSVETGRSCRGPAGLDKLTILRYRHHPLIRQYSPLIDSSNVCASGELMKVLTIWGPRS